MQNAELPTNDEAYQLMVTDYNGTKGGTITPTETIEGEVDHLKDLRRSLTSFALSQSIDIHRIAHDTGMSVEALRDEIEADSILGELLPKYSSKVFSPETLSEDLFEIDSKRIGWVKNTKEPIKVSTEEIISHSGQMIRWADLTGFNRKTFEAIESLEQQDKKERLIEIVKSKIPGLLDAIKSGQSDEYRPVNIIVGKKSTDNDRSINTTYPAYKIGVEGTDNRAILLVLNGGDEPVIGLAALFDHDDQDSVLRALSV